MSDQSRRLKLKENMKCPIKSIPYQKLDEDNWIFIEHFLEDNKSLSDGEFKAKANYLFIDEPRPKNHIAIIEVLMMTCKSQ